MKKNEEMIEKVIRDNVHGDIKIREQVVLDIINTPELQRLRRIFQLGGAQYAYPGATHTRFSHSIGTYHLINKFLESKGFASVTEEDQLIVKLAGLMHDVGHGAFSHTFEHISHRSHEEYTIDIIANVHGNIRPILEKYEVDYQKICDVINGVYPNKAINLLVSSQLDADRMDYLKRDSINAGVNYASLDIEFIIRHAKLIDQKIVFDKKAVPAIESYLLGRYHMYKQIYNHKISVAFDAQFKLWFKRVKDLNIQGYLFKTDNFKMMFSEILQNEIIPVSTYLMFDDFTMFDLFKICISEEDQILSDLSSRLLNGQHFAAIDANLVDKRTIQEKVKNNNLDLNYYFSEEELKKPIVYKNSHRTEKDETIYIDNNGKIETLTQISVFTKSINEINQLNNEKKYLFPKEIV